MFQTTKKYLALSLSIFALASIQPAMAKSELEISNSMSEDQKAVVNDLIHQFIMNNPEVLLESVELYQKRLEEEKNAESKKASADLIADIKSSVLDVPYTGNKEADLVVVEFLDYNCGFCKRGFQTVNQLLEDQQDNVKVAFIDLPVLGASSREAAKYAVAAQLQDKYFEYHVKLFEDKRAKTEATFLDIAKGLGLDPEKLKADANGEEVDAILKRNRDLANKLGISGTPAFIVGSEFVPGYIPYDTMKAMIKDQK